MERVYVGNLPPDIRIKDIDDFFRPFGKLVAIDVNNRSNPAFAFVQFESTRNALSAVRNRHGYDYEGYTLQVKLVENNVGSFEVRNQSRQITPPPPPPMFNNDFNNQMGGGFGNNNFGRNGGNFGGNNFGSNNFGNGNFNNLSSSSFQRNIPSQNMIQYPSKNVRSIMPAQNNMIEYPTNNSWGSGGGGGVGSSNRGGGGGYSNRGGGRDMGNDFNNMGGGYSFNPNNNCYADDNFEDRFTQGLSGSGRKWFNRYIQKGFAPKIAREKALEHRNLPYLREGPKSNQIANNAVANLPLPALENFGNKLLSLFSGNAGGGGNFGGSANQMMSNFNNWGNNMQGGFSNDFNTAGPSSSNYRLGNRNNDRALMPRKATAAMNRSGRPNTAKGSETGILDKMLAEIPSSKQLFVAKNTFYNSMTILEKLNKKTSKGLLNNQDVKDKQYHKQIVKEYQIWIRNKKNSSATQTKIIDVVEKDEAIKEEVNKDITKLTTGNATKNLDDKSKSKEAARYKSALTFVTQFEWRKFKSMTKKEKNRYEKCTQLILAYEKKTKAEKQKPMANLDEKTAEKLWQEYEKHKSKLLKEALLSNPNDPPKRLSGSGLRRMRRLQEKAGINENEAKTLAILPQEKLEILITFKSEYDLKTGENIKDKLDIQQNIEKTFKTTSKTYDNSVKFLKKYEKHDLTTLTEKELALIRICLRRKRRIDQEEGLPLATTRFDHLLTDETDEDANILKDEDSNKTQNKFENNTDSVNIIETTKKQKKSQLKIIRTM